MLSSTCSASLALFLCALLPACLETEEEIEVHPDGSVEVTVAAQGDPADLAAGHSVPTWGPWRGVGAGSQAWLAGAPAPRREQDENQVDVKVRAAFGSVADLPAYFAPPDALYRSAHLERQTTLEILPRGQRTVYVFERRLLTKALAQWNPNDRILAEIPEAVSQALDDGLPVLPEDWRHAVSTVQEAYGDAFYSMAQQALLAVYLEGGAELSVAGFERTRSAVRKAVVATLDEARIQRLTQFLREAESRAEDEHAEKMQMPFDVDLEKQARGVTRRALPAALEAEGLAPGIVNAVLERLEWAFSAVDNAADRGDDTLRVKLRLPGRVVGGTYDEIDSEGRAVWEIKEDAWKSGEIVLRAVSVLE